MGGAAHHRSDAYSSIVAMVGIAGAAVGIHALERVFGGGVVVVFFAAVSRAGLIVAKCKVSTMQKPSA